MTAEQITTTIETLTAEVRAVMIGKRQVTLSVYRQLDTIPWADIEPFGRVRDKQDDFPGIYVVGRHRDTSVLSRASIHRDSWIEKAPAPFVHWLVHRRGLDRGTLYDVGETHSRKLQWSVTRRANYPHSITSEYSCSAISNNDLDFDARHDGKYCGMEALEGEWQALAELRVDELFPHELEYQNAEQLPLIVLAGLR